MKNRSNCLASLTAVCLALLGTGVVLAQAGPDATGTWASGDDQITFTADGTGSWKRGTAQDRFTWRYVKAGDGSAMVRIDVAAPGRVINDPDHVYWGTVGNQLLSVKAQKGSWRDSYLKK